MVCFANELRNSVVFEIAPKYCISDSFVDYESYSHFFLRDSYPQSQINWSSELNLPILVHFSPLKIKKNEKSSLKFNIQKPKIIASSCITSWQIDGEKVEKVTDFIFLGSKITAESDCGCEMKRHLLFGRKPMTNLDSILKSRNITLLTKFCPVKAMVFPVVMYGCES